MTEPVPDRGPAAYIAEFVGTLVLVLMVASVFTLFVASGAQAQQFGSDYAVVGLVNALALFFLVLVLGATSGAHLNPAVTLGALLTGKIKPIDAAIYVLVQLSGGVAGALMVKWWLVDEGRAGDYGAAQVSTLIGGNFQGAAIELVGTFLLVLSVLAVALNPRARAEWAPIAIGMTLGFVVMVFGPLTGGAVNPARWFGPALVSGEYGDVWPYLVGPLLGGAAAAAFYRFVLTPGELAMGVTPTAVEAKAPPEAPGKRGF